MEPIRFRRLVAGVRSGPIDQLRPATSRRDRSVRLDVANGRAALTYFSEHPEEMAAMRGQRRDLEEAARDAGARTVGELLADLGMSEHPRRSGSSVAR